MAIKRFKPTTPSRRSITVSDFSDITRDTPYYPLTEILKKHSGRNNFGRITTRHRGGRHKRRYRIIDFKRDKDNITAIVESIEYDPNRSARIALLKYMDGERRYIIAPQGLKVGDKVCSGEKVEPKIGNCMPVKNIPVGSFIHNLELLPGRGGQIIRSAGTFGQLVGKEQNFAVVTLPSGEIRKVNLNCRATIGQISNPEHHLITIGKAGRSRWLGIRPCTRGSAQNPCSHPMGGGNARRAGGRHPVSKWGKLAKGAKTRNPRKASNKYIIRGRTKGRFQFDA